MVLNSNKDINEISYSTSDNDSFIGTIYETINETQKTVEHATQLLSLDTRIRRGDNNIDFDKKPPTILIDEEKDKNNTLNSIKASFNDNIGLLCLFMGSIVILPVLFIQFDSNKEEDQIELF